jgi:hypothetical protein
LEEVDKLAFLFGVQTDLNLHGFGWFPRIDSHGLGVLIHLENTKWWGHGRAERLCGHLEAKLPEFRRGNHSGGKRDQVNQLNWAK